MKCFLRQAAARRAAGPIAVETRPAARRAAPCRIWFCLSLAVLWLAPAALAHPMGNFTISHASALRAESDKLTLRYRLDYAEIPTVSEMRLLDANGDKSISEDETADYLRSAVPKLTNGLRLMVDGRARALDFVRAEVAQRPGAGGLPTLLVMVDFAVPLSPASEPRTVEYADDNYPGRAGWREIIAAAGDGVTLTDSDAPPASDSDGLVSYPTDELAAPPQVTTARFTVTAAGESVAAAPTTAPAAATPTGKPTDRFAQLIAAENLTVGVVLVSLAVAFTLGCFHALAPGHGKTVVAAYLVGARGTAKHAAMLGAIVTFTHTVGVFALGLVVLFLSEYILPERLYPWLGFASGMIIVAIGLWSLTRRLARAYTPGQSASLADPHGPGGHTHAIPDKITLGSLIALGVSGGMVPVSVGPGRAAQCRRTRPRRLWVDPHRRLQPRFGNGPDRHRPAHPPRPPELRALPLVRRPVRAAAGRLRLGRHRHRRPDRLAVAGRRRGLVSRRVLNFPSPMVKPRPLLLSLCLAAAVAPVAVAQVEVAQVPGGAATQPGDGMIALDLPQNVEIGAFVQYVSGRLGFNVIYDAPIGRAQIALETPKQIPREALLGLLQSVLRANNLLLVDEGQPGFKKIVPIKNLVSVAPPPSTGPVPADAGGSTVVTHVFQLQNADPAALDAPIKALLTTPGGNSFSLPDQRLLIVSDFADNVRRIGDLIRVIDTPGRDVATAFVTLQNAAPAALTEQLQKVLTARLKAQGASRPEETGVEVVESPRTGQIALLGPRDRVEAAKEIIAALDVAVNESASPIRFYKLANTTAADLLATIRAIEGEEKTQTAQFAVPAYGVVGGVQSPAVLPGAAVPQVGRTTTPRGPSPSNFGGGLSNAQDPSPAAGGAVPNASTVYGGGYASNAYPAGYADPFAGGQSQSLGFASDRARVAADPNTNTLIVIAEPPVQAEYEQLINRLDKPPPAGAFGGQHRHARHQQAAYSFGVDVSYSDTGSDPTVIAFDSFGISRVNAEHRPVGHSRRSMGFNAAVLSSDVADVVLRDAGDQQPRPRLQRAARAGQRQRRGPLEQRGRVAVHERQRQHDGGDDELRRLRAGRHDDPPGAAHQRG